jgi:hypothetical protein
MAIPASKPPVGLQALNRFPHLAAEALGADHRSMTTIESASIMVGLFRP